ncbi:hypothetical protein DFH07DRAFT_979065 [Mycena maculata]|uniref:MYND-type domain-containing protein n=1 Tax=Mycena maculata TaxID=230809 RepID=A0AAD7K2I3_9AGAR|nr:hypothetical protein DFH07DRAFT_979065 [Mycena maculata]
MSTIRSSLLLGQTFRLRSSLRVRFVLYVWANDTKSVARAALNGSSKDLAKLYTMLVDVSLPEDQAMGLLPFFYVLLDPSSIPDLDLLDTAMTTSTPLRRIDNAAKSLASLAVMARNGLVPLDAAPDLWPRVWEWMEFLHTYWLYLPGFEAWEQPFMRSTNRPAWLCLGQQESDGLAWATIVRHNDLAPDAPQPSLGEISIPLLSLTDAEDIKDLEEIMDACGGSYSDLAIVLIRHLSLVAADSKSEVALGALTSVLMFLHWTYEHDGFRSALLSNGIISALVSALDLDGPSPIVSGSSCRPADACMETLVHEQAVEASQENGMYSDLKELLCTILPKGLVSYTVVIQMKKSFSEIGTAQNQRISHSPLFENWNGLKTLVEERVKVLDTWESAGRPSFLACDNMKCNKINKKDRFRRCSACHSASYCSSECQRVDWLDRHRNTCDTFRSTHLAYGIHTRERAFMRALLHADYQRLRFEILLLTLGFMNQQPAETVFVYFDYTSASGVKFQVCSKAEMHHADEHITAPWDRVARADGRMALHVMRFRLGQSPYEMVIPLRTTSLRLHDGVRRIASIINTLQPSQVEALLRALMQTADREGTEIH